MININSSKCPEIVQQLKGVYPVEQWTKEGFFEESDLLDVDCHWLAFEPPHQSVHFSLAIIYFVIFLVGFFSNTFTIYIIVSSKKLLTPANILHTNLAISDLLIVLMIPVFIFNSFHKGPAIGKLGCSVYGFLCGLSGTCSIMTLAAIAFERYLVISRSLNLRRKPTRRWAFLMSISTWMYSTVFASMPLFGIGKYVPEGYLTSCSFNYLSPEWTTKIFILAFFIGAWVVPMTIMVYSYSSLVRTVAESHRAVAQIAPTTDSNALNPHKVELKVSKVVLSLICAWTVAWTPYAIVALIGISGHSYLLKPLSATIPAIFAKLATCVDPFVYALNQPKIRNEISFRLNSIFLPDMNSLARPAAAVPKHINPTDHGSSRLPTYSNSRLMVIAGPHQQLHQSKEVICRPNPVVRRPAASSSLIANENYETLSTQIITISVSCNDLYEREEEHRRHQLYGTCWAKSAPTSPILNRKMIKKRR